MKDYSNLYCNNFIDNRLSDIDYDSNKLFRAIVDISTANKFTGKFYEAFKRLLDAKVLKSEEKKIVKLILDFYESSNGLFPDITYLKSYMYSPLEPKDYNDDTRLQTFRDNPFSVPLMAEQLIKLNQSRVFIENNKALIKKFANEQSMPLDFIYKVEDYRNTSIPFNTSKINENLNYVSIPEKNNISQCLNFINPNLRPLSSGSVNCLIKNKFADNFFEIFVIYNAIIHQKKNVCFISTTWSITDILNKFIAIHSYSLEEDLHINYCDISRGIVDIEKINLVLADFKVKADSRLVIYDNNSLNIFNLDTFRKLIMETNYMFNYKDSSLKGIDLLVIDCIENLRLENDGEIEDNVSKIIKTYSNFIIRQSKLCFREGFEEMTVLVSTHTCNKSTFNYFKSTGLVNDYVRDIETTNSILEKYADTVTIFALNERDKNADKLTGFVQVIKNVDNQAMNEIIDIEVSLENCKFKAIQKEHKDNEYEQTKIENIIDAQPLSTKDELEKYLKEIGIQS